MAASFNEIDILLNQRSDYQARLRALVFDGTPEIKENKSGKYLYIRKRVAGKLTSTYIDVYSDDLYTLLVKNTKETKEINKRIREINKKLSQLGYEDSELPGRIRDNIDFARINMKSSIYEQSVLEGIGTSFPQTEEIIDNGIINGVSSENVQKILNLKHAWEFILDENVVQSKTNYQLLCHIAKLINEGLIHDGGRIRGVPVTIGGCKYMPPIPMEIDVIERIDSILSKKEKLIDKAIKLCLYCMRTQIFKDGNKRAAVIFANHYLIANGMGFIVIPEEEVSAFKKMLVRFYETNKQTEIMGFLKAKCWRKF